MKPWRTAADCIDWTVPAPSIFERTKPLADATCRRIAKGIVRYVYEAAQPFVAPFAAENHHEQQEHAAVRNPNGRTPAGLRTGERVRHHNSAGSHRPRTSAASTGSVSAGTNPAATSASFIPTLIQTGYGERPGQQPRVPGLEKPLGTVVAGQKHALVTAFLAKHYTGVVGSSLAAPMGTATTVDHHSLITAHMVTIDNQSSAGGHSAATAPLKTTVTENRHALVTSHMIKLRGDNVGAPATDPVHTISAQGTHHGEVRAFLVKYYGTDGDPAMREPLHTVTTKDRFGLVLVHGEPYAIVDIGLRMLTPRELYRAQGFPESWVPLMLTHEGQYPEEVAYGPQIMMDRLGKWLGKYFDQEAQADSVQEDAARESEYRRGYRHGYEQRDAEVRGAMA